MKRPSCFVSPSVLAVGVALSLMGQAHAARADEVPATGKGIAGGALLGGEVVMLGEALVGVKSGWAYLIGGVVGAGGGGYLGYVAEQNADPKVSVYLLAGGMALVIPTTVAVLQATAYKPPEEYTEDRPAAGSPIPEPPRATPPPGAAPPGAAPPPPGTAPGSTSITPESSQRVAMLHYHWEKHLLPAPTGLFDLGDGSVRLAMPSIEIRPAYAAAEIAKFGVTQHEELRVPVFSATF
jgi:hypothetical protein